MSKLVHTTPRNIFTSAAQHHYFSECTEYRYCANVMNEPWMRECLIPVLVAYIHFTRFRVESHTLDKSCPPPPYTTHLGCIAPLDCYVGLDRTTVLATCLVEGVIVEDNLFFLM